MELTSLGPHASHQLVDPLGFRGPEQAKPPVRRLGTLGGGSDFVASDGVCTIGLLDISKAGGSILLNQLERRLVTQYPNLRCVRFAKPTFSRPMPLALASEISKKCSAVVAALAD